MNKDWVIIILSIITISLFTYIFIYPYLMNKMLIDAIKIIGSVISNQLITHGEAKITVDNIQYVLIEKSRCKEIENKTE